MWNVLTITGSLLASASLIVTQGAETSSLDVAQTYIAAYSSQDFETMEELMADDAVFIDPTSFDLVYVGNPIHWTGFEEIRAGISSWNIARGVYHIDRVYEAAGRVVFDATMDVFYATSEGERGYRYPIVTIITVEDGLVTEHRDYTGFNEMAALASNGEAGE